jgi:hypothetical protein
MGLTIKTIATRAAIATQPHRQNRSHFNPTNKTDRPQPIPKLIAFNPQKTIALSTQKPIALQPHRQAIALPSAITVKLSLKRNY